MKKKIVIQNGIQIFAQRDMNIIGRTEVLASFLIVSHAGVAQPSSLHDKTICQRE
jgi:hypothetical protein